MGDCISHSLLTNSEAIQMLRENNMGHVQRLCRVKGRTGSGQLRGRNIPLNIISQPYGLMGGEPGARGLNLLIRKDGRTVNLGGKTSVPVYPGVRTAAWPVPSSLPHPSGPHPTEGEWNCGDKRRPSLIWLLQE